MKKTKNSVPIPTASEAESVRRAPSDQWIQMRVTTEEKEDIVSASNMVNRNVTDYLLQCHRVVAAKLRDGAPVQVPATTSVESHPPK